ncbi:MAG: site-2 protease family protein, partial [Kangiellaceae bacterium]|nr:site-2 protease family protein [Kangiellaceae bacterium]
PTDPRNFNSHMASLWVSAAGPGMNLVLAFLAINLQVLGANGQIEILGGAGPQIFLSYMAFINLILMLFNLLPIGPLDGHYILPYFLSRDNAIKYLRWNEQYGTMLLMGLVLLSIVGVPIFSFLMRLAQNISRFLIVF